MSAFENRSLPFEDWTHQAHMRMAWNYISAFGNTEEYPTEAARMIIEGIKRYNEVNQSRIQRGYNETVTRFYIHMVWQAIRDCQMENPSFEEFIKRQAHLLEPELLWRYYTPETVGRGKGEFLPPDKQPLPSAMARRI